MVDSGNRKSNNLSGAVVSFGISITTGPGLPEVAIKKACLITSDILSALSTVKLCLTIGLDIPIMSVS